MSQGVIQKRSAQRPYQEYLHRGTVICQTCQATFDIYYDYAFDEDGDEQATWLKSILDSEHNRNRGDHDITYRCPF